MNYDYIKKINIHGLRNPKLIQFGTKIIIIGSKEYCSLKDKKKYLLYSYLLDENINLLEGTENILNFENIETDYKVNINISSWIRDIYLKENKYYLLIEFKKNNDNEYFTSNHYLLKTSNFLNFEIEKKYNIENIFFKDYNNNYFISKIEKTNHIWGKYLFEFIINDSIIIPIFDNIVDYDNDYGHILHNLEYIENLQKYYIIFSIRHHSLDEENNFYYKIYEAFSNDLINYYDTKELELFMYKQVTSNWFCYPWKFYFNNNEYIVCNQDDYGKNKEPILFIKNK